MTCMYVPLVWTVMRTSLRGSRAGRVSSERAMREGFDRECLFYLFPKEHVIS